MFAYAKVWDVIRLEPGESEGVGMSLTIPYCRHKEKGPIYPEGACGAGGVGLSPFETTFERLDLVLVADGYPESGRWRRTRSRSAQSRVPRRAA